MRAAIDIGSNSIRLSVADGSTTSHITQLAAGIEKSGVLSPVGVQKSIDVLKAYAQTIQACDEKYVFATEAVRRAKDGDEFCARVKREAGLTVTVLSGEQEAFLALAGTTKPDGPVTVCDLGGGSLEVISSADGVTPDYIKSLPLGVVVLKNTYCGDYRKAIDDMPRRVAEYGEVPLRTVVISGGSACTISAAMLGLTLYDKAAVSTKFSARELDGFMPMLLSDKLTTFRPITSKRADTLPYGAIIIQALLNHLNASEFYVSDASNLEAALAMPKSKLDAIFGGKA